VSNPDFAIQVQRALDEFVGTRASQLGEIGDQLTPFFSAASDAVRGGKRLRPSFCYWGWRAAGGDADDPHAVVAAASLELLHASALVHDDVMDDSATRRGLPATHKHFAALHAGRGWGGGGDQFGTGAAILLGDLLLSWADQMLRSSGLEAERLLRGLPYFDLMRNEVVAGQYLDLVAQRSGVSSVPQSMLVVRYKSAKYTVERPLHLGAALAGADEKLFGALSSYGLPLGEAFQLRDDLLGVFGDPAVTGKPAGDDIRQGKRTMLVALAVERADGNQSTVLRRHLGRSDLDETGVAELRAVIEQTDARDRVEQLIDQLSAASATALDRMDIDDDVRRALHRLAGAATRRES
jgi:geranylgeranyl diphosphate synthase, type I